MILIVGASGVLGKATLKRLLAAGHRVRVLTRDPKRVPSITGDGMEVVQGDLVDRVSLARACDGVDRVFATAHGVFGRGRHRSELVDGKGHRDLIDVAREAGVLRFVYTSALGVAPDHPIDFFRTKFAVEEYLRRSGLAHVVLRPSAFMEWHAHAFNGKALLEKGRAVLLGSGSKRRNFVAARDVAEVAVHALTDAGTPPAVISIGGPGNFSNDEVARLYARCAGIEPRVRHIPRGVLRVLAPVARVAHPGIGRVLSIAALADDAFDETFHPSGEPDQPFVPTSLEDFVKQRVAEAKAH